MSNHLVKTPQFFLTAPTKCPYLHDKMDRKVFTYLNGDDAVEHHDALTFNGFRRSQNIAYRPICDGCNACVSVRIPVNKFKFSSSMRRIIKINADLTCLAVETKATQEQFSLFRKYLDKRHMDGSMANMTYEDFKLMMEESPVDTCVYEYRLKENNNEKQRLIAVALTDVLADGYSMVYSFYDPDEVKRSLGSMMILDHVKRAKEMLLSHIYLGYWVKGCSKMEYKKKFKPLEYLTRDEWQENID